MDDFKDLINSLADLVFHNLPALLGISLAVIKLLLIFLSGSKERWKAVMLIPEELSYAALGIVIAGLSGAINDFDVYFRDGGHPKIAVWLVFGVGILVCFFIHLINNHGAIPNYQGWRAADAVLEGEISEKEGKKRANISAARPDFTTVYYVKFSFFIICLSVECLLSLWFVKHIGEIIEHH
jgi:hypothetical protein